MTISSYRNNVNVYIIHKHKLYENDKKLKLKINEIQVQTGI